MSGDSAVEEVLEDKIAFIYIRHRREGGDGPEDYWTVAVGKFVFLIRFVLFLSCLFTLSCRCERRSVGLRRPAPWRSVLQRRDGL